METGTGRQQLTLSDEELHSIARLAYKQFGVVLNESKRPLIIGRLQKVVRDKGMHSIGEYIRYVEADKSGRELLQLTDKLTTNHTFFFREAEHFEFFTQTALPEFIRRPENARNQTIRLWCAGCSSGEEIYTLQILMREFFAATFNLWKIHCLATDISTKALAAAEAGIYCDDRVKDVSNALKFRYFQKQANSWQIRADLRSSVMFKRLNFMRPQFPFKQKFHFIWCRNVMIYFDDPTRQTLVKKFHSVLAPGGYLFIGHSETLGRTNDLFEYVQPALYRKKM